MITDVVRHEVRSYRQLPVAFYQFRTGFRDEIRPRCGLMRCRESLWSDAYSFHAGPASLDRTCEDMRDACCRILDACELDYTVVEADAGRIGGSGSHGLMASAAAGESAVVRCPACAYAANVEAASIGALAPPAGGEPAPCEKVATPGLTTVPEVAEFLGVTPQQMLKTLIYDSDKEELVAVAIRGDREVNEVKLANLLGVLELELAREDRVREATGAPVGFAGPVGLPSGLRLIADESVRPLVNFVCGANQGDAHLAHVNWGRDAEPSEWADLVLAAGGDRCPRCPAGVLELCRGIAVGHLVRLGTRYSEAMGCTYLDEHGQTHAMEMGWYGLGLGPTVAAVVEQSHDADGIVWPLPLAPFAVLLIALNPNDAEVCEVADRLYDEMTGKGLEVLYDDRNERPGVKFKDADLIGLPVRVVVGKRGLAEGKVEISLRRDREKSPVSSADVLPRVAALLDRS